jgi:hypothetical protein
VEHLCYIKEIGCWGHLCIPEVLYFTLLPCFVSFDGPLVDFELPSYIIFSRGENGELRVGVRRANLQQSSMPSSVISSHSMHLGVLATARHATQTKTMFIVYYKPRTSQFIISLNKYLEAMSNKFSVGMRFKMRFEGEDSPERR